MHYGHLEMHLESTEIPTRSFAMLGGVNTSAPACTGADDDTLLQDAIARFPGDRYLEAIPEIWNASAYWRRNTDCQSSRVEITRLQYYDGNQLRNGLFFIYDYCGKDEVQDLRLYLLDSKVSGKRKRNYAKTHGKNDVSVEIEIASQGSSLKTVINNSLLGCFSLIITCIQNNARTREVFG